jgi:hypothetical protein
MLNTSFYKTMIGYLQLLGGLTDTPFAGNPDYPAYWALFTAAPTDDTIGATEATFPGYARKQGYRNPYHWGLHDGPPAYASNTYDIAFNAATGGAGQVITHWAFLYFNSDLTTYKIVASGPIENPLTISVGLTIEFPTGQLRVQVPAA